MTAARHTATLGLSCFYHDAAAALVIDGEVVAAAQEERFTRRKHDPGFPAGAVEYCLQEAGIDAGDLDDVVFYEDPRKKFGRVLGMFARNATKVATTGAAPIVAGALGEWVGTPTRPGKLRMEAHLRASAGPLLEGYFARKRLSYVDHHVSHAASAFHPSPYDDALVLVMDGVGEWLTTSAYRGQGGSLRRVYGVRHPDSLGLLYAAFTYYCGFRVNSGEYKLMGLAPYGEPRFAKTILEEVVRLKPEGRFEVDQRYVDFWSGRRIITPALESLLGAPALPFDATPTDHHIDVAASAQAALEEVVLHIVRHLRRSVDAPNMCLAGGVALNCVANGRLLGEGLADEVWVQPAAGDAGGALGAALQRQVEGGIRPVKGPIDGMRGAYLGPRFDSDSVGRAISSAGAVAETVARDDLARRVAALIADGNVVGLFHGRMEFGPRALGNRSILGDPRDPEMQRRMNLKIKFRESFRPFAPAVLAERCDEWFESGGVASYMNLIGQVAPAHMREVREEETGLARLRTPRSTIPAVTHVDGSARLQTVHKETNPLFHEIISEFDRLTGVPVVVNTSFNVRGEPIVHTPADALRCFLTTGIDALVLEDKVLLKSDQPDALTSGHAPAVGID